MKTFEPLPLLDCIKELSSLPPSPQKSLDMNDEDQEQESSGFLDEFKASPPKYSPGRSLSTPSNDIKIQTITSVYNLSQFPTNVAGMAHIPVGQVSSSQSPHHTSNSSAKIPSAMNHSDSHINSTHPAVPPLGVDSLPNLALPESLVSKSHGLPKSSPESALPESRETLPKSSHDFSLLESRQCCHIEESLEPKSSSESSVPKSSLPESRQCCQSDVSSDEKKRTDSLDLSGYSDSRVSLSRLEMLSPYVRTNEFLNDILKSPVREPVTYEEPVVPCGAGEFKDVNLNSPLKNLPSHTAEPNSLDPSVSDPHLMHLRTLEEIDEEEALCLCSHSVSSTLSSTTKRQPCISDSADVDSGAESASSSWERTVAEVKSAAIARLQEELRSAHEELKLKDEEVTRLSRLRGEVESELEELTASLFQEAHNMVREANIRHATSEKLLKESKLQVDVLQAEVAALKTLVLTSTPSRPNPHLHPQIEGKHSSVETQHNASSGSGLFRKHRRSPSHCNLKYGREDSPPSESGEESETANLPPGVDAVYTKDCKEVDPVVHKEFLDWRSSPTLSKESPFIARIYSDDIGKCLEFSNTQLAEKVRAAIDSGDINIEAVSDKMKASSSFPRKCALLEVPRLCLYRMKLGENSDTWYYISKLCRNRIIKVCDFLNYLLYVQRGLVKSGPHDVYWEINRLRKEIVLARLGLTKDED